LSFGPSGHLCYSSEFSSTYIFLFVPIFCTLPVLLFLSLFMTYSLFSVFLWLQLKNQFQKPWRIIYFNHSFISTTGFCHNFGTIKRLFKLLWKLTGHWLNDL
jgi:hypothetical protein